MNPAEIPTMDGDRAAARAAPRPIDASTLLARAVELCRERRAENIVSLDVQGLVDYMDHLLIVTGRSARQNRAIAEHVLKHLKREHGILALSRGGMDQATWICLDFVDVVLHVFDEETRAHYDLELLWADAERTVHESGPVVDEVSAASDEDDEVDEGPGVIKP